MGLFATVGALLTTFAYAVIFQAPEAIANWNSKQKKEAEKIIEEVATQNNITYEKLMNNLAHKHNDAIQMVNHAEISVRRAGRKLLEEVQRSQNKATENYQKISKKINEGYSTIENTANAGSTVVGKIFNPDSDWKDAKEKINDINKEINSKLEDYDNGKEKLQS